MYSVCIPPYNPIKIMKSIISFVTLFLIVLSACGDPNLSADCKNILPPSQSTFSDVYPLFTANGEGSCSNCHSTNNPTAHYDLSTKPSVYDALTTHFDVIYAQVASGTMPPEDSSKWTASQLQTLSSWYCYGGFYDQ